MEKSEINPHSSIRNPQSISNPQSPIFNSYSLCFCVSVLKQIAEKQFPGYSRSSANPRHTSLVACHCSCPAGIAWRGVGAVCPSRSGSECPEFRDSTAHQRAAKRSGSNHRHDSTPELAVDRPASSIDRAAAFTDDGAAAEVCLRRRWPSPSSEALFE